MKNISVILPLHSLDGDYLEMFNNAVLSVEQFHYDVKLVFVGTTEVAKSLTKEGISDKLEITILENTGETDFCSQVNFGIENCDTEWFSILEVDDVYTSNWLNSIN